MCHPVLGMFKPRRELTLEELEERERAKRYHELLLCLDAACPLIFVVTSEEHLVLDVVADFVRQRNKRDRKYEWFAWSMATGLLKEFKYRPSQSDGATNSPFPVSLVRNPLAGHDPMEAFGFIQKYKGNGIFVFVDFHHALRFPVNVRALKDTVIATSLMPYRTADRSEKPQKTIVCTMPVLELPDDLRTYTQVIDLPMPSTIEIEAMLLRELREKLEEGRVTAQDIRAAARAACGLTLREVQDVCAKAIRSNPERRLDLEVVRREKQQIIRKGKLLEYIEPEVGFDDIGGLEGLKNWVRRRARAFSDEAREFGLEPPRGVVLVGIQGCGKSYACKAIARELGLPLLRLDVGTLFEKWVGSSEANTREALKIAESIAPCVLWLDEIDKSLGSRGDGDSGTTQRVIATVLTWMQERRAPVFVVATANDIAHMRPELLRKGRFDEIFFVDLPDARERKEILAIHLRRRGRDPERFDLDAVSQVTEGWSGSELEELVKEALYLAFDEGAQDVTTEHLLRCARETQPLSVTMKERIEALRSWARTRARSAR